VNTYKIVGPLNVVGHEPGEIVSDDDLEGCDIEHLIGAGHLASTKSKTTKVDPATSTQED
jgi:hypothetical protein